MKVFNVYASISFVSQKSSESSWLLVRHARNFSGALPASGRGAVPSTGFAQGSGRCAADRRPVLGIGAVPPPAALAGWQSPVSGTRLETRRWCEKRFPSTSAPIPCCLCATYIPRNVSSYRSVFPVGNAADSQTPPRANVRCNSTYSPFSTSSQVYSPLWKPSGCRIGGDVRRHDRVPQLLVSKGQCSSRCRVRAGWLVGGVRRRRRFFSFSFSSSLPRVFVFFSKHSTSSARAHTRRGAA